MYATAWGVYVIDGYASTFAIAMLLTVARSPIFTIKWLGTGVTMSRRTANKKLTKLYGPS